MAEETGSVASVEAGKADTTIRAVGDQPLKLDIGCGKNKVDGFVGIDSLQFEGVDHVLNLVELVVPLPHPCLRPFQYISGAFKSWPIEDNSVDEVHCSHFLEHLTGAERIHFFNELYRVLKPGAQARIITPHWSHERAYGDPTHMSAICSWTYFYLDKNWREGNGPHSGYTCDFMLSPREPGDPVTVLSGIHDPNDAWVAFRTLEVKQVFMSRNINTTTDMVATLTKK